MQSRIWGLICIVLCSASVRAQDESFRVFFDTVGDGGSETGPRSPSNLAFTNPTIEHSGRLFLYLQYGTDNQDFSGTNIVVEVAGPGELTGGNMYNHSSAANLPRWGTIPNKTFGPGAHLSQFEFGSVFKVGGAGFGAKNVASNGTGLPDDQDTHFDRSDGGNSHGTTLLGYTDVAITGPGEAQVFLHTGNSGFGGVTITANDYVYFGFGDAAMQIRNSRGRTSIPEAYIVPEPATLLLLVAGAFLAARRSRFVRSLFC